MTPEVRHFLVAYDPSRGELLVQRSFDQDAEADEAFIELEREHRGDDIQVVLFTGDSWESVQTTHPHYFAEEQETAPFPAVRQ